MDEPLIVGGCPTCLMHVTKLGIVVCEKDRCPLKTGRIPSHLKNSAINRRKRRDILFRE